MSTRTIINIIIISMLCLLWFIALPDKPAASAPLDATAWEYKTVEFATPERSLLGVDVLTMDRKMNQLGASGWEYAGLLCTAPRQDGSTVHYIAFRRRK